MPEITRSRRYATALLFLFMAACADQRQSPEPQAPLPAQVDSLAANAGADSAAGETTGDFLPAVSRASRMTDSLARIPRQLSLRQIGYRDGVTLTGSSDVVSLAIPVNSGTRPTSLQLRIIPTPGMPLSNLRLTQQERTLAIKAISDTTSRIDLDLNSVVVVNGKATIDLGITIPEPDACLSEVYYRTVLLPESEISYSGIPANTGNLADFFPPWLDRVTFYLAESPSLDAAQATLDAATFVARRYRGMSTVFEVKALPSDSAALSEPGPWDRAVIWSPTGESRVIRPDSGRGTVLALAARRDSRQLFTLASGDQMVTSDSFRGGSFTLEHQLPRSDRGLLTLNELGYQSRTIQGSAVAASSYSFSLADLGGGLTPVAFRLIADHSGVPAKGSGTIQLLLNGSLIHSRPLDRRSIDQVISLPGHLLNRENTLNVRFQIVQPDGECRLGGATFTATIDALSSLVTERGKAVGPGFGRFPGMFVPAVSVLLEPRDRYRVELAATLLGSLQATTQTTLAPALARDRGEATGSLLAIGGSGLADFLAAPVHSDSFRLRDRDGRVWDEFTPATPFAAMQGWEEGGRDILLLHHTGSDGLPLAELVREILTPYGWFGVRGDLALRGISGETHVLSAANAGWRLENGAPAAGSMANRIRSAIFIIAALVLTGLLLWLYPKVVRREPDTTG